ncbi:predicted protein [Sparassis crispa]|uniref:FYVE-type domain-containing protein n=1 Tax=Sparassis crispa TaxID=139825 RepID=A0A401GIX3_9APHY|nr:predicted protein [Sparassis crispa]GBE82073.1 predicted protein [Sparassis crispa]
MDSSPYVPYQAYKSKRHSRHNSSNPQSAAPQLRPQALVVNGHSRSGSVVSQQGDGSSPLEKRWYGMPIDPSVIVRPASSAGVSSQHGRRLSFPANGSATSSGQTSPSEAPSSPQQSDYSVPPRVIPSPSTPAISRSTNGKRVAHVSSPVAGPSSSSAASSDKSLSTARKTSTFRHVPLRAATTRMPLTSSPLRPTDAHSRTASTASTVSRQLDQPIPSQSSSRISSTVASPTVGPHERALPSIPSLEPDQPSSSQPPSSHSNQPHPSIFAPSPNHVIPPPRSSSLMPSPKPRGAPLPPIPTPSPGQTPSPAPPTSVTIAKTRASARSSAPYRPGFQPKGVYRPRTDDFLEVRKVAREVGRIERTRLERRLEKLISLHFPSEAQKQKEEMTQAVVRPAKSNRRLSSIFEFDISNLKGKNASDLWKEMMQAQAPPGAKGDIRDAEKTITPWEDDASVSQCPLCSASFHPLTNRKHHCRLCGRIICSLPVKYPQRPQTCSLLFIADPNTGRVEEVGEGVDYGVRRHSTTPPERGRRKDDMLSEDEKFLKGVRICRDCRPVLLHQQYKHEVREVPLFAKLYSAFMNLEKEIEDSLPQFQELMLSLSKHERPTPEATAARKRLLDAFGQYDVLAKRIRQLPPPGGPGSSQDRIQQAILARANLFLQKHMFPLQALPKPQKAASPQATPQDREEQVIDPDSEVAHVLQPLLEQEALLETFVEEAKAHRKFEDAKTLKANLREIRAEIERILVNAESGDDHARARKTRGRDS